MTIMRSSLNTILRGALHAFLPAVLALASISACEDGANISPKEQDEPSSGDGDGGLEPVAADPATWTALSPDGTVIGAGGTERKDKYVGMFYYLWHGCHGYDTPANNNRVVYPTAADVRSPFNNEEIMAANPSSPRFGDFGVMHHWGEPYLGYYLSNDEWVIRKHGQMLHDAGVDVIFFDVTNGYHYLENVKTVCQVFADMRKKGCGTPRISFLMNAGTASVFNTLYDGLYAPKLYEELWFRWDGKPLLLANPDEVPAAHRAEFTLRRSWFLYNIASADAWFGSGEDKWPWGNWYPQQPGMHQGQVEEVSVLPATHAHDNMGRSYDPVTRTEPKVKTPEKGIFYRKEIERALELDPRMIFITSWNEWTAQRQKPVDGVGMIGGRSTDFGCYFVDEFSHEYSRDLEPVRGGFGDVYYYMTVDMIRRFKGTPKPVTYSSRTTVSIDGDCADWKEVPAAYGDDMGDTRHRSHQGWGRVGRYLNTTGRNDIVLCKVANDADNLYFYVQTAAVMTPCTGRDWMRLYISTRPGSGSDGWEGFGYRVNGKVDGAQKTSLERSTGGYKWQSVCLLDYRCSGKTMELAIPMEAIGISDPDGFSIEFKWIDNAAGDGDIQTCMTDGDSAPDCRFRYVYNFSRSSR